MADERLAQTPVNSEAVRVGVVDLELAPFNPAAIAAHNADSKFERVGTLVPGSAQPEFTREWFELMRGLPQTAIKSMIIGQEGTFPAELDEYTAKAIEIANGGASMIRTTTSATTVSAAPPPTKQVFTVAAIGTIAVNDWVAVTIASVGKTFDAKVKSIAGSAITLYDPLPVAPVSTDAVAKVTAWQQPIGGVETKEYTARLVFTDTAGDKAILHMPKVMSRGRLAPGWNANEQAIIPLEFKVYGIQQTINGKTDFYLGSHYLIPAGSYTPA